MANYYELLGISPDASVEEIRSAYDEQYRELSQKAMRHHDQAERLKAEQKRLDLEKAIAVLVDPVKRAEYDAELGDGQGGGLYDREVSQSDHQPSSMPFTPPPSSGQKNIRVDAWVCPKCQHPNPIGTRYCQECGHSVGFDCPNCGERIEATAKYCPECRAEIKLVLEKRRQRTEVQRRQQQEKQRQYLEDQRVHLKDLQGQRDELQLLKEHQFAPLPWTNGALRIYDDHGCFFKAVLLFVSFGCLILFTSVGMNLWGNLWGNTSVIILLIVFFVIFLFFYANMSLRFAKPKIDVDIKELDSEIAEVRSEIHKIENTSIQ